MSSIVRRGCIIRPPEGKQVLICGFNEAIRKRCKEKYILNYRSLLIVPMKSGLSSS